MSQGIQGKDPRSDKNLVPGGHPQVGTGSTGDSSGGYRDFAGVDLGNGTHLLLVVNATRNNSSVAPSSVSEQLLPANSSRVAATIVNTDSTKNLYIGLNGAAAVVGANWYSNSGTVTATNKGGMSLTVPPGGCFNVPTSAIAGVIQGIWDAGATGNASITETTA